MQLVLEEVSTSASAMTIVDGKVAALWPARDVSPPRRLRHVQDDRDPVLVVVALDALVRVGRVGRDQAVGLGCKLR